MWLKRAVAISLIIVGVSSLLMMSIGLAFGKDPTVVIEGQVPEAVIEAGTGSDSTATANQGQSDQNTDISQSATDSGNNNSSQTSTTPTANGSGGSTSGSTSGSTGGTTGGNTGVAPVLSFSVSPSSITSGQSSTLTWSIGSNATTPVSCIASSGWSGAKSSSGNQIVSPTSTTTYSLTCTNSVGSSGVKSVSINVNPPASSCNAGGVCHLSDVAQHNTQNDCWFALNDAAHMKVYKATGSFYTTHANSSVSGNKNPTAKTCGKALSYNTLRGYASQHGNGTQLGGNSFDGWLSSFYYSGYAP